MQQETKKKRGRPKTFDREHTITIAMNLYWCKGVDGVSLNEICNLAGVSKPSLYREFGSEDGLMKEVLIRYRSKILEPVFEMLKSPGSFRINLNRLIELNTEEHPGMPKGCLFVKMRGDKLKLETETRKQIEVIQRDLLATYSEWINRAKLNGEFPGNIDSEFAASYISSQMGFARNQQARGESVSQNRAVLEMALSVFDME